MIHRALFGSLERFFGVLLEHLRRQLPLWLAPVQVEILPVAADHEAYAERSSAAARGRFRVEITAATDPLGKRIRNAKKQKIPYVLVVGDDDVALDDRRGESSGRRRRARRQGRRLPVEARSSTSSIERADPSRGSFRAGAWPTGPTAAAMVSPTPTWSGSPVCRSFETIEQSGLPTTRPTSWLARAHLRHSERVSLHLGPRHGASDASCRLDRRSRDRSISTSSGISCERRPR